MWGIKRFLFLKLRVIVWKINKTIIISERAHRGDKASLSY